MIDPLTGREILPGVGAVVADVKEKVKKSLDERVNELEERLDRAHKLLVALSGHSDPLGRDLLG